MVLADTFSFNFLVEERVALYETEDPISCNLRDRLLDTWKKKCAESTTIGSWMRNLILILRNWVKRGGRRPKLVLTEHGYINYYTYRFKLRDAQIVGIVGLLVLQSTFCLFALFKKYLETKWMPLNAIIIIHTILKEYDKWQLIETLKKEVMYKTEREEERQFFKVLSLAWSNTLRFQIRKERF